ncbi:phosphoribosylformylglycinamidine synthase [Candidatus Woesearchaeota archaeon]|nr:phosphoribosylformylglycinamidine synthase [Candidatus Woesearchaeota archaeon]
MSTRIEVMTKESIDTSKEVLSKVPIRVYNISDDFTDEEVVAIRRLLADSIADKIRINEQVLPTIPINSYLVELSPKPGVTVPEDKVVQKAIQDVIGRNIGGVSFSEMYLLRKNSMVKLGNGLVNDYRSGSLLEYHFPDVKLPEVDTFKYVDFVGLDDEGLLRVNDERLLSLNIDELRAIKQKFLDEKFVAKREELGLDGITDAELEAIAQTWSEHCKHKKFNARWKYVSDDPNDESGLPEVVDSLFKSIIQKTTYEIMEKIGWIVSVFHDNSGVIKLNDRYNLSHKVETHNHPSKLYPFGGANTGSGGVFRDINETGIGMKIVSSQCHFRVADSEMLEGVVDGVEDYGNKEGEPTILGSVQFDLGWEKPAIYVGATGVALSEINGRKTHIKIVKPGYLAISLGGSVGKDGIHGATCSSEELSSDSHESQDINQSVQIGNPIVQRCMFEAVLALRDKGLIEACQDCGAGGWNSAVGELAEISGGAVLDLSDVPEKYKGLTGWEKLVSESQERGIVVAKPENLEKVLELCKHFNVNATVVAEFNDSGYYEVKDQGKVIGYLPIDFLHGGVPRMTIEAHWQPYEGSEPKLPEYDNLTDVFLRLLEQPNLLNYNWMFERYDHEVQGGTIVKPMVGLGRGKSDAVAKRPVLGEKEVVIESYGGNPLYGDIDAYHMGVNNVVEAYGKIIALGGNLDRIVNNGNTTCPKPEEDKLVAAKVMRMLKGAADAELVFGGPRISGKDSTSMQVKTPYGVKKARPDLLISALGVVADESTITTCDFKMPGDVVYVVGKTEDELGGSEYYRMHGEVGMNVPKSNLGLIKKRYELLSNAIGLLNSCQYISKGGLGYALANCSVAGDLGVDVILDNVEIGFVRLDKVLFSETPGRFLVSIHPSKMKEFEKMMNGTYVEEIGTVRDDERFHITSAGYRLIDTGLEDLRERYFKRW